MFNGYVAKPLQATVTDARHQVAFLHPWHENRLATKQALEDVATDILALLPVQEQRPRHSVHPGIVLHEQPFNCLVFHHVFTYNTHKRQEKLTLKAKIYTKVRIFVQFGQFLRLNSAAAQQNFPLEVIAVRGKSREPLLMYL